MWTEKQKHCYWRAGHVWAEAQGWEGFCFFHQQHVQELKHEASYLYKDLNGNSKLKADFWRN